MLRNDDLLTRGLEPIHSSRSVRSRSGMGVAVVAPYSSSATAYLFEQSCVTAENLRSVPRAAAKYIADALPSALNAVGLPM